MTEKNMPDYSTIQAAVEYEAWAIEKVLDCYSGEIDKQATVEEIQPDGSVRKVIDEDIRQVLVLKLIEAIPQFPLEKG